MLGKANEDGVMTSTNSWESLLFQQVRYSLIAQRICQTLDEVFVVVPRETFDRIRFDERICTGWHLYSVDFCLSAGERGYKSFALPMNLHHRSPGYSMDDTFYENSKESGFKAQEEL